MKRILAPGRNCWRIERSARVAFLIDAAEYFSMAAAAMERAQQSIVMVGWDFHSETCLRVAADGRGTHRLADVLAELTRRTPGLSVHILCWDYSPIYLLERELLPSLQFRGERVHFRFASDHPLGASHHQKVVVIDDRVAFLGGLDLTIARWDERGHRPHDRRRQRPNGELYGPFHDAQIAVDGAAAAALGELVRERWRQATGTPLEPPCVRGDPWPPALRPNAENVDVALARTQPAGPEREAKREVEQLHLDAIAAARRAIYIENEYLTSLRIAEALCARLAERNGPEIVIVTAWQQSGRLEQATMGVLRVRIVRALRGSDAHGRLRLVSPLVGGEGVNVHAKLMVVDDSLVHVGSANLSTRSMRLDTECDAAIEAHEGAVARAITELRDSLVAEHLGADRDAVARLAAAKGLIAAVDRFRGGDRTLTDLEVEDGVEDDALPGSLVDPRCGLDEALARYALPPRSAEHGTAGLRRVFAAVAILLVLAALWAWTPLASWVHPQRLAERVLPLGDGSGGLVLATAGFALAGLLMIPVTALIVAMTLAFDTWTGIGGALVGSLVSASAGYGIGRLLGPDRLERFAGGRRGRLTRTLEKRGLIAVCAIRIVPIAPFTVVNLVAGGARIRFRDFLAGTLIGMAPGIVVLAMTANQVAEAVRHPGFATIGAAAVLVALLVFGLYLLGRFLARSTREA